MLDNMNFWQYTYIHVMAKQKLTCDVCSTNQITRIHVVQGFINIIKISYTSKQRVGFLKAGESEFSYISLETLLLVDAIFYQEKEEQN